MKERLILCLAVMVVLSAPAFAQFGSIKGACKDAQGKPLTGAVVELHGVDSSHVYKLKTDSAGNYSSLGIMTGQYNVTVVQNNQEIFHLTGVHIRAEEKVVDLDLQHAQDQAGKQQGLTPEQMKQSGTVKALNDKLLAANQALEAGNLDSAITSLTEATGIEASHTLLWSKLGDVYLESAVKQTDSTEKKARFSKAADSFQKAIDLKQKELAARPKTPQDAEDLGHYYNNMAHAQAKSDNLEDSVKSFNQAIQLDPDRSPQYYYNLGAILANAGKTDEAISAFDKAIAADPKKPEAYYQKGVALIAKSTTDPTGKIIPAPGTQEALNKYLELAPNGPYADGAKGMIKYVGGTVEIGTGKSKK